MSGLPLRDRARNAATEIERLNAGIEGTFANVGAALGRGHTIFENLNRGLSQLSSELSGTNMEDASASFQDIAENLARLAGVLAQESSLLGTIAAKASNASTQLKSLLKHVQMITIIARSARIEAASLDKDRESFLNFTQGAADLAKAVQVSLEDCSREQARLAAAICLALERQREFETNYGPRLVSVGAEMANAYRGLRNHQANAIGLAETTSANASRIAASVGLAIVSLQAGDSMRQRLEHIYHGLRMIQGDAVPIAADEAVGATMVNLVGRLQAEQLHDASGRFAAEIHQIGEALSGLQSDVASIDKQGGALYCGGDDDRSSFLSALEQNLSQTSELIASCETARRSVDEALSVVEETLGKFRGAVSELSQTVVDIILIGMNAGLRASHLGVKGSSFVVIANELKVSADQISGGARMLQPILDDVAVSASELSKVRAAADSSQLAKLEPAILKTIGEVRSGNDRLGEVMRNLADESAEFEALVTTAQTQLASFVEQSSTLPVIVGGLRSASDLGPISAAAVEHAALTLGELYAQYTMSAEREVHRMVLRQAGVHSEIEPPQSSEAAADEVLFF